MQQLQALAAEHAQALARVEHSLRLEISTVVSAMSDGLQQQADLRSRAADDTLADIQMVWERCKDALAKTESEMSRSSECCTPPLTYQLLSCID